MNDCKKRKLADGTTLKRKLVDRKIVYEVCYYDDESESNTKIFRIREEVVILYEEKEYERLSKAGKSFIFPDNLIDDLGCLNNVNNFYKNYIYKCKYF